MGNMRRGDKTTGGIPTCTVSSTIPTKYQTIVISNREQRGFSCQAKRFPSQVCLNENPGPGSYGCISSAEVKSPSFSRKGTTGFVRSKVPRKPQKAFPAPNAYNLQSSLTDKHDFNVGVSRVFRRPLAEQRDGPKHETPAPNQYDLRCDIGKRFSSVAGTSAFLSKSGRDSVCVDEDVPSPSHYHVDTSAVQLGSRAILSPFKSKTQRISDPVDQCFPGPGTYNPYHTSAFMNRTTPLEPYRPRKDDLEDYSTLTAAMASRIIANRQANTRPPTGFHQRQPFPLNDTRIRIPDSICEIFKESYSADVFGKLFTGTHKL